MCTVTWLPAATGYQLFFNRDEKKTRKRALPPAVHKANGVRSIFPVDGDAGGTWLGVNECGLTLGMLNHHPASGATPAARRSRGLLLRSLLDATTAGEAVRRMEQAILTPYAPFIMVALETGTPLCRITWDGRAATTAGVEDPCFITTSSFDSDRVTESRRRCFVRYRGEWSPLTAEKLIRFHQGRDPEPGPLAVCMEREDACTLSFSHVSVTADGIAFAYADGPPCRAALGPPVCLPRKR